MQRELTEALELLQTPDGFEAWLLKNTDKFVGVAGEPCRCPLFWYLSAHNLDMYVGEQFLSTKPLHENFFNNDMPEWAKDFVAALDDSYTDKRDSDGFVKGYEALQVLRETLEEGEEE